MPPNLVLGCLNDEGHNHRNQGAQHHGDNEPVPDQDRAAMGVNRCLNEGDCRVVTPSAPLTGPASGWDAAVEGGWGWVTTERRVTMS